MNIGHGKGKVMLTYGHFFRWMKQVDAAEHILNNTIYRKPDIIITASKPPSLYYIKIHDLLGLLFGLLEFNILESDTLESDTILLVIFKGSS